MSHDSAFTINHELRSHGFASLSEAGPLIAQLAMCVRDHGHLRALITACEPQERGDMYEALAPNLRFKARPLADYLIEAAQDAERRQLPTIGEDGHFKPFKVPEVTSAPASDEAIATAAAAEGLAKERLWVVCVICTRELQLDGITKEEIVTDLRRLGWRMAFKSSKSDPETKEQVEVCPACVRQRAPRIMPAGRA